MDNASVAVDLDPAEIEDKGEISRTSICAGSRWTGPCSTGLISPERTDRADLSRARLSGANLVSANLESACLAKADMEFALMAKTPRGTHAAQYLGAKPRPLAYEAGSAAAQIPPATGFVACNRERVCCVAELCGIAFVQIPGRQGLHSAR